ncbi:hypothetical protein [Streptomyces coerulescens]|uniref:Uncharacterized protein n=1 Tax=Streptomyces coerulescens TaxID=29304 RepID=A0ABW0CN98_STRCD
MSEERDEDQFDGRLGPAPHDGGAGSGDHRTAVVAAGTTRGRRLGRLTAAVAGAVGIALVVVGGMELGAWGDDPRHSSAKSAPDPTSRADLVATLKGLLPQGRITEPNRLGAADSPYEAEVVYDDGEGPAAIGIGFTRFEPVRPGVFDAQAELTIGCPTTAQTEFDSCVTTQLPDTSRVTLLKQYVDRDDRRTDTMVWSAALLTPSGQYISVTEWNSAAPAGAPISRAEPPLSGGQLKEVVTAPVWRRVADAVVENEMKRRTQTPAPSEGEGPTVAAVMGTLVPLLPKDLKVFDIRSDYPYVNVYDAEARNIVPIETTVLINVQQDTTADVADELYGADAETLPDGTKVATRQGPGDKGVAASVMRTVDTMRADGLRVVISAYNPASRGTPTRSTPALTIEQLREIALSPKWDRFGY